MTEKARKANEGSTEDTEPSDVPISEDEVWRDNALAHGDLPQDRPGYRSWEGEMKQLAWEDDNNPWKREALRIDEERRYLQNKVMRMDSKIMSLNAELNRMKSPPLIVGTIIEAYGEDQAIVSTTAGPSFLVRSSSSISKEALKPGVKVSMNKDTMSIISILPSSRDPLVGASELETRPEVTFDDIGGLEPQIDELREVIELPLLDPESFRVVGIDPPKGVLLIGPPGCGKTLIAKAIANATRATFLRMVGSELVQKYIGEGSRMVRELFQFARERSPSIIFLDEIDSIAGSRTDSSTSADREVYRTLIQLLAELDGFDPLGDVRIIAATNRPDILDPAILRPGRIDRIVEIPLPDLTSRIEIFKVHTRRMNLDPEVSLEAVSLITDGFNGAQIKSCCTEAGMFAIRAHRRAVNMDDLKRAVRKVIEGASSPSGMFNEKGKGVLGMFA
ncbi:MAG: proteasome-activating nucleotidase [Candidatus Thermoplasmatota archaeon]|nr:proteasome-activating nucleotidase [Candidatus Thermoplasmatota archaeon]